MTLRDFQHDYLREIAKGWTDGWKRQLVVAPTGSGKTVLFSFITKDWRDRVLILVDQDELVWQTVKKIEAICGITPDVEKAEHEATLTAKVVVGSVQTLMREKRRSRWPQDHFGLVIADEADKSIAPSWMSVLNHFDKTAKVLGFTATPNRTDQRNLGCYYENKIECENLISLIRKGFLAPLSIQMLPIKIDVNGFGAGKDFTDGEADCIITPHLEEIAKGIQNFAAGRRTLVFLPLIKTCEKFSAIARDIGLICDHVYGVDEQRDSKIQEFRDGFTDVLANSMLLTRGVDVPEVNCIVPCRPTKSVTLYTQQIGRGTRLADGKKDCLILDFLYQASKKLVCRPAHLIAGNQEEADQITQLAENGSAMPGDVAEQMDLLTVAGDATAAREEVLRKKLEEQKAKRSQFISAEAFAMQHNSLAAAEFEPTVAWESAPVTEKQAKYLEKAHIDISTVKGKGQASALLNIYFNQQKLTLASQAKRFKLRTMGYPNWNMATDREFRQVMAGKR